ncbi:hypothetical protein BC938DRAFT_475450 [Jimgerdemannia flammicorona]|uniref:Uncharacterized protein n=1 Tax=Jimgerdemannia flammicorona TaxID=994334 RepID=A0A433QRJ3_9FUNG|nr:hypothetical protein BC938DRAFT_475450 [Jimgerdemannia flammicorona]
MENTIPKMIFGSHLDSTSAKILGYGVSLGVALYLAQRWKDGNKSFDIEYMTRGNKPENMDIHAIIAKHITPNLKSYTPRVVRKLHESIDSWLGGVQVYCAFAGPLNKKPICSPLISTLIDSITIEIPYIMVQDMVAKARTVQRRGVSHDSKNIHYGHRQCNFESNVDSADTRALDPVPEVLV